MLSGPKRVKPTGPLGIVFGTTTLGVAKSECLYNRIKSVIEELVVDVIAC